MQLLTKGEGEITQIKHATAIDEVLRQAVESGGIPGVIAIAADASGVIYEGAFGQRELGGESAMTMDTVVWIASMTKAITATAAMQLVERGALHLDRPAGEVIPTIATVQVLEGFAPDGSPRLRAPRRAVTLRQLLTHTSGFGYDMFNPLAGQYMARTNTPPVRSCRNVALNMPLMFEPGERWEYGIGIDWVGKMVEAASGHRLDQYFRERIFAPLEMDDTSFRLSPAQIARLAGMHARAPDGRLSKMEFGIPQDPEFHMGGGGLYSTARDYLKFARMILRNGQGEHGSVLQSSTVTLMAQNHIGELEVGYAPSFSPTITNDVEWFNGVPAKWGLSFLINQQDTATGRAAGSLAWAGLANTYYWIDRARGVTGVFLAQVLPFFDRTAVDLFTRFETGIYRMCDGRPT